MAEHVLPLGLNLVAKRRCADRVEGQVRHAGVAHLRGEDDCDLPEQPDQVRVPVHVDDVVEVRGPASLCERPEFLAEQLGDASSRNAITGSGASLYWWPILRMPAAGLGPHPW